jgi:hypothetical protein
MAAKFGPDKVVLPTGSSDPGGTREAGEIFYNTSEGAFKYNNGSAWTKIAAKIPLLTSVSGTIYNGLSGRTVTLTGTNFLASTATVHFNVGGTDYDVSATASNDTTVTVTIPSGAYNAPGGSTINVAITNNDGARSGNVGKTVVGLPSGGNITTSGNYRIHTFTGSSTLTVPSGFSASAEYLIIAGGGGGGTGQHGNDCGGGGAGAGGYIAGGSHGGSGGGCSANGADTISAGSYSIVVGGGGNGATGSGSTGSNGGNSSFNGKTAIGGGGGAGRSATAGSGGSGGGGSCTGLMGNGTSCQGYGYNVSGGTPSGATYGGSGAGGYGSVGPSGNGGAGGAGQTSSITGSNVTRAGGGGGGKGGGSTGGAGGSGGGGNGGMSNAADGSPGTANTGGGGGGGGGYGNSSTNGGNGGSGVVIIRYQL